MRLFEFALNESFKNLFSPEEKEKYVDQVWNILQKSYEAIGGIKGTSKEHDC